VSFKQFFVLVEGTADAAFAVDGAGRISAWNTAAAQLFGVGEAQAIGTRCHQLLQCADEDGIICSEDCIIQRTAQESLPRTNFDLRLQTKTGKLWCSLSTLIVSDAKGMRHAIYIVRPVEIRKRLEQALSEFVRTQARNGGNGTHLISSMPGVNVALTSREIEVLKSLANGHNTRAISNHLNISTATVNNHIKHILTKLDAHTRLEAIRHAESAGVI